MVYFSLIKIFRKDWVSCLLLLLILKNWQMTCDPRQTPYSKNFKNDLGKLHLWKKKRKRPYVLLCLRLNDRIVVVLMIHHLCPNLVSEDQDYGYRNSYSKIQRCSGRHIGGVNNIGYQIRTSVDNKIRNVRVGKVIQE